MSNWTSRGKTVSQLIKELQTSENQELEVPISLVAKVNGRFAMLKNCEDAPSVLNHRG